VGVVDSWHDACLIIQGVVGGFDADFDAAITADRFAAGVARSTDEAVMRDLPEIGVWVSVKAQAAVLVVLGAGWVDPFHEVPLVELMVVGSRGWCEESRKARKRCVFGLGRATRRHVWQVMVSGKRATESIF
jgi:hypothetical protein